jgi:hypothetical protein
MKKKIKIKFVDFGAINQHGNDFTSALQKRYDVEISDTPDYIFFSDWGRNYLRYQNCIRIYFTNENLCPDFNVCDYGIGFSHIAFEDRYLRLPFYLLTDITPRAKIYAADIRKARTKHLFSEEDVKKEKTDFCSFVYTRNAKFRNELLKSLSCYKSINCGGGGGGGVNNIGYRISNKVAFEAKHKFSIACENSATSGYTTEKIMQAFAARTVPIYWGDPNVTTDYNEKAFINCNRFGSLQEIVEKVKEIDTNDEKYFAMLREPAFSDTFPLDTAKTSLETFLYNIFDQKLENAKRRNDKYFGFLYERKLRREKIVDDAISILTFRKLRSYIHSIRRYGKGSRKLKF